MKKLIVFLICFIGFQIKYHHHTLSITFSQTVYADDWADEFGDDDYDYNNPSDPNLITDPNDPNYDCYLNPTIDGNPNSLPLTEDFGEDDASQCLNCRVLDSNFDDFLGNLRDNNLTVNDPRDYEVKINGVVVPGELTEVFDSKGNVVAAYFSPDASSGNLTVGMEYNIVGTPGSSASLGWDSPGGGGSSAGSFVWSSTATYTFGSADNGSANSGSNTGSGGGITNTITASGPPNGYTGPGGPCNATTAADAVKAAILNRPEFATNVAQLRADAPTATNEESFVMEKDPNTGAYTASTIQPGTNSGNTQINITANTVASAHLHPTTGYDSFSPFDLYSTGINNFKNSNFQGEYVIAGTGVNYMLIVDNQTAFTNFAVSHPFASSIELNPNGSRGANFAVGTALRTDFDNAINAIYNTNGMHGDAAVAGDLAYMLDHYNMGMTLLKSDGSGAFHAMKTTATTNNGVTTYTQTICVN